MAPFYLEVHARYIPKRYRISATLPCCVRLAQLSCAEGKREEVTGQASDACVLFLRGSWLMCVPCHLAVDDPAVHARCAQLRPVRPRAGIRATP
jgi:hypothetical protein